MGTDTIAIVATQCEQTFKDIAVSINDILHDINDNIS